MARFYPLYVRRSDGKLEVTAKGKRQELNQPTEEQLDRRPDKNGVSSYYREVSSDEQKHLDWRRKLGGMLAREMGRSDKDGGYILVTFPEHYRLYEHVKKAEKDGKTEVKSKTHAAGANDRQDAYLYGHSTGRKKRYRSPADFFPHLLWLCTDESGDPDNCSCKLCSPEDLDEPVAKPKPKQEPEYKVPQTSTNMVRQSSVQSTTKAKPDVSGPSHAPKPANPPRPLAATPLPPAKTIDQQLDRQYNSFMYRAGEVVWFKRGAAWGLGAVLRRWASGDQSHYSVQPLSHPYQHPPHVVKSSNAEMRPWLAWSVPKYTNDVLNSMPHPPTYATADWQGILNKQYGQGDMEVDASILAAKTLDSAYTPFGPHKTFQPEPGVTETYYDGLFLGAEKVWVGDPLRLVIGSGTDVLVLHSVQERKRTTPLSQQLPTTSIHLFGDVYQLQRVSHSNPAVPTPASASANPNLPQRMTEDLAYRNARSIPIKRQASYFKLATSQSRVDLDDIKGRWYEASLLLPILQGQAFDDAARKGEIQEASQWMNSRSDCQNSNRTAQQPRVPKQNHRRDTRQQAFGSAIPAHAQIVDGVQPPPPDNFDPALEGLVGQNNTMEIDPRFDTAENANVSSVQNTEGGWGSNENRVALPQQQSAPQQSAPQQGQQTHQIPQSNFGGAGGEGIDEFMNLDGMDDAGMSAPQDLPGFGREYDGSQGRFY